MTSPVSSTEISIAQTFSVMNYYFGQNLLAFYARWIYLLDILGHVLSYFIGDQC